MSDRMTKLKGRANEAKGKVKKEAGRVTGNDRLEASGRADGAEGKAQVALGNASQKVKKFTKKTVGKR